MSEKPSYGQLVKKTSGLEKNMLEYNQLKQELALVRKAIESASDAIGILDPQGRPIYQNKALEELFGYTMAEYMAAGNPQILYKDKKLAEKIYASILNGKSWNGEVETLSKSGRNIYVSLRADVIRDFTGEIIGVIGVHTDITQKKTTEKKLLENEARLRTTIENLPFDFFVIDEKGRYVMQNSTCKKHWGDLTGKRPEDIAPNKKILSLWKDNNRRASAGEIVKGEITYRNEGEERSCYNIISPVLENNKISGILGINIDITDRKRAEDALKKANDELLNKVEERTAHLQQTIEKLTFEISERKQAQEALQKSEERLSLALDATREGLWDWDLDNQKVFTSARFKELTGLEVDDQGRTIDDWLSRIHPNHIESVKRNMQEHLDGKGSYNVDYLYRRNSDEEYCWHNVKGIALFNDRGKAHRMVGSIRDINDQKRAEELIRNLTHKLIKSQENERQMISSELHDSVAQDLSSSRIIIQMLSEYKSLTPGVRKKMLDVSASLQSILKSIRNLSYDLRPPGLEKFGLTKIIYQHCNDFTKKNGIMLNFSSAGMDNINLNYDSKINIYRLIQEALNNIKKHAEASSVNIKLVSSFPDIILRIEDDGKGFYVNQCLANSTNEKHMGLGSMQERVSLLQGTIDIKSIPNQGTKIFIKIPYPDEKIIESNGSL